jgi:hypothetical protein
MASGAVSIAIYVVPADVRIPSDAWCAFTFKLSAPPLTPFGMRVHHKLRKKPYCACPNFFKVGPMAVGWDESAWAAKGLPATGVLSVELTISMVGHMP